MNNIFIIAEVGVNHNGDINLAKQLIDVAVSAGADAVKFQAFDPEKLVTQQAKQANYQTENTGLEQSQFAMLASLNLHLKQFTELAEYCKNKSIEFMASAFDADNLHALINQVSVKRLKIGSGEITNWPFLLQHGQSQCDVILSTGMANLAEVEQALMVLAFAYAEPTSIPTSFEECSHAYQDPEIRKRLQEKVTLLHCTSYYPAPAEAINLNALITLKDAFHCQVGYSDHSLGGAVALGAVALGAKVIEKHITLDQQLPGPDHKASMEPNDFQELVRNIRELDSALGDGIKQAHPCEDNTKMAARRSLVAKKPIAIDELFTPENIHCLRPSTGTPANQFWDIIGKPSRTDYQPGDLLNE